MEGGIVMFSYVKLRNYRSLIDFQVDLTGKRSIPKKMILIYGENGVGKSNFASAFFTLYETLRTCSIKGMLERLREQVEAEPQENFPFQSFVKENFRDIEAIIKNCKTIDSDDNMVLEYGFRIKGQKGVYRLETNDTRILSERLEFVINKNRTVFFDISEDETKLNEKIFKTVEYEGEVRNLIEKYWGKHSLLSILVCEIEEKKDGYVKNRICRGLYTVISYFMTLSIRVKDGYRVERGKMGVSHRILGDLNKGTIGQKEINELNKAEQFLNEFFTRLYSDVKQVYYKKEQIGDKVSYQLVFRKMLYGRLVDVDFEKESTGTQYLLEIVPFLISCVEGRTVVLDEMDTGIHDLLVDTLLGNLYDSIEGQVIITTHNTMLLESELAKDCVYIFHVDENANKELMPLSSFEERVHPNLNIRKRYIKGMYGGIPMTMDVDFGELLQIME